MPTTADVSNAEIGSTSFPEVTAPGTASNPVRGAIIDEEVSAIEEKKATTFAEGY